MVPPGNFHELGKLGRDISPSALARFINDAGVHILVTLNGWTSGHQLDVFALRPAPLQVEYMGSHDSTGARFMQVSSEVFVGVK
jgi:predicted O-linked N-acetylglucosamine transferase (SPINDLY family)